MSNWCILEGDCLQWLRDAPADYFDSMVSDPPAGVSFMHREWDSDKGGRDQWIAWLQEVMQEAYRCLKPGAHCLVWALPRTSHWTATALEDAGFEVRDVITHHFGNGFPKSQDVRKFIDKLYTAPATEEAKTWDGWGTALKPSTEHWILCRKPLSESSIARNVLKWKTGGLNIDGCRVPSGDDHRAKCESVIGIDSPRNVNCYGASDGPRDSSYNASGRWPTNLLLTCTCEEEHDDPSCPVAELDRQSGYTRSTSAVRRNSAEAHNRTNSMGKSTGDWESKGHDDAGGSSRFFPTFRYQAKPSRKERELGLEEQEDRTLNRVNPGGLEHDERWKPVQVKNNHPTVKSIELCRWLTRLITPPGGKLLDPFAGSGSIGCAAVLEGFDYVGIEKEPDYCDIARARIDYWANK